MRCGNRAILAISALTLVVLSTPSAAVEPDRPYARVGKWQISTARYGIGCVAVYSYRDGEISIGGLKRSSLSMVVVVDRNAFDSRLFRSDGGLDEDDVGGIELVLDDKRWGGDQIKPYGYRGTPGVVVEENQEFLESFVAAPTLKLTERGSVKLIIKLEHAKQAVGKLYECFKKTR